MRRYLSIHGEEELAPGKKMKLDAKVRGEPVLGAVGSELSAALLPELLLCPCAPRRGSVVKLCR